MNETGKPERRRFQFGVRKLLLWMTVAALGLGLLSILEPDAINWVVAPGWFAAVCIVRSRLGSMWAAVNSMITGALGGFVYGRFLLANYGIQDPVLSLALPIFGSCIGFVVFVLAEFASRAVNSLDGIGRSDG